MDTDETSLRALALAQHHALSFLKDLDRAPVGATVDLHTLRQRLNKPLADSGLSPEQVITELVEDVGGGLIGSAGGRFFGWVIGGSLPAALAADWLTATWDQNAALYATSPAAAVVEEVTGLWLKDILGLPAHASFALVSGCQMAHATCLAAARHALLAERGWDVEERGLYGAPPIRILSSQQRHGSFERAVRLLGLGREQVVYLTSDSDDRLEPEALQKALESDPSTPTIVLLQAGDINIGAFDIFEALIPLASCPRFLLKGLIPRMPNAFSVHVTFLVCAPGLSLALQPWAKISERLRRILFTNLWRGIIERKSHGVPNVRTNLVVSLRFCTRRLEVL